MQSEQEGLGVVRQAIARVTSRQQVDDEAAGALREVRATRCAPLCTITAVSGFRQWCCTVLGSSVWTLRQGVVRSGCWT